MCWCSTTTEKTPDRDFVVDDQALVRARFCALLEATDGLEVVAEAVDGADAVELAARHEPDVVLMDIRMPRLDGIAATRQVLALSRPRHVLILTTFDTDENVFDALEAGAVGFLVKDTPPPNSSRRFMRRCGAERSSHRV